MIPKLKEKQTKRFRIRLGKRRRKYFFDFVTCVFAAFVLYSSVINYLKRKYIVTHEVMWLMA